MVSATVCTPKRMNIWANAPSWFHYSTATKTEVLELLESVTSAVELLGLPVPVDGLIQNTCQSFAKLKQGDDCYDKKDGGKTYLSVSISHRT